MKSAYLSVVLVLVALVATVVPLADGARGRVGAITFVVDDTRDIPDRNTADGVCRTRDGTCTLRAAAMETNGTIPAPIPLDRLDVRIELSAGTYVLDRAPSADGSAADGDLHLLRRSEPGTGANRTVTIVGRGAGLTTIRQTARDRVFMLRAATVLENLTVTGGQAQRGLVGGVNGGGGIGSLESLTLRGVAVTGNRAPGSGGGISSGARLIVDRSVISDNHSDGGGGGIAQSGEALSIRNSTITGNTAVSGGGVAYQPGEPFPRAAVEIVGSLVADNTAGIPSVGGSGGGVFIGGFGRVSAPQDVRIVDSTIRDNVAVDGAGIAQSEMVNLIVERSLIEGNTAATAGGGIGLNFGHFHIENVTITGNGATDGGGVYIGFASGKLRSDTFANNTAARSGVSLWAATGVEIEAIIFGDTGLSCYANVGVVTSLGFNVSRDASCQLRLPSDAPSVDPRLGPLANNGGPSMTHALLAGSPAIDRFRAATCPLFDQRAFGRPAGAACDSGAFESGATVRLIPPPPLPPRGDIIGGGLTLIPLRGVPVATSLRGGGYAPCTPGSRQRLGGPRGFFEPSDAQLATRGALIFRRNASKAVRFGNLVVLLNGKVGSVVALVAPTRGGLALFTIDQLRYGPRSAHGLLRLSPAAARLLNRLLGLQGFRGGMPCGQLDLQLRIGRNPGPPPPVEPSAPPPPPPPPPPQAQTFTLNVSVEPSDGGEVNGPGIDCPGDCNETFTAATSVTLTRDAADDFEFDEWEGACSGGSSSCSITMDGDKSVTAKFKAKQQQKPECSDGKDNDNDGFTDFSGQDPQCSSPQDDNESK
jgi:hypothetical protein